MYPGLYSSKYLCLNIFVRYSFIVATPNASSYIRLTKKRGVPSCGFICLCGHYMLLVVDLRY